MDFANRGNRPVQQGAAPQQDQQPPAFQPPTTGNKKRMSGGMGITKIGTIGMLIASTLLLIFVVLGLILIKDKQPSEADLIKTDKYQAVFLNSQDGQVYFGKLSVYNRSLYRLSDIFYVRVEQPIQPEGANQQQQANISLAKLGNELHGPEDEMFISKDKVLYWENLKDDGQVKKAIQDFIDKGRKVEDTSTNQNSTQQSTQNADSTQQTTTETDESQQ